ncbi:MAG: N-acetyltransferase [Gammaproteobacteria bacterium]|nr:N-acetyltransferase [Gammaproteobacteria bacterium]MDH3534410.1 N-acetyltransferase [Gammaproteobacteria bacterium]
MKIRAQLDQDRAAVRAVNRAAFGSDAEADLVDAVRTDARPLVSLVATDGDEIVGHILFSSATLAADPDARVMALGPMSVAPQRQRQGIGSALVQAGLDECRRLGCEAVFVLGHPHYYPRFGFVPASKFAISSRYEVPADVFMAMELAPGALTGKAGIMSYHEAFDGL